MAMQPGALIWAEVMGLDVFQTRSNRSNGEMLFEDVRERASEAIAFGRFRIMEVAMADHYGVSRTVVRDVLARLEEAGLVRKENRTHWVVGPLTADLLVQQYEVRILAEPYLLLQSIRSVPSCWVEQKLAWVIEARQNLPAISLPELDRMEDDLHNQLHRFQENNRLKVILSSHGMPSLIKKIFNRYLGPPTNDHSLREHEAILRELSIGDIPNAVNHLAAHLKAECQRSVALLKAMSVVPDPDVVPFLRRQGD